MKALLLIIFFVVVALAIVISALSKTDWSRVKIAWQELSPLSKSLILLGINFYVMLAVVENSAQFTAYYAKLTARIIENLAHACFVGTIIDYLRSLYQVKKEKNPA